MKRRILVAVSALALSLGITGAAHAHGDGGKGHTKLTFPMKGDEFQKHIEAKVAKMRAKMESRLTEKQVPADKAKEIRANFDAGVAKLSATTKEVTADGVVTQDEAQKVREVAKSMRPHRGGGDKKAKR